MKRFTYLVVLAAASVLAAGAAAAQGSTRPDDRPTHGPGAVGLVEVSTTINHPDGRAARGPGAFASNGAEVVRPDDRAWRGVGSAPVIVETESPASGIDGFDWADAAIGAAGALGIALLLMGSSALVLRRQRVTALT